MDNTTSTNYLFFGKVCGFTTHKCCHCKQKFKHYNGHIFYRVNQKKFCSHTCKQRFNRDFELKKALTSFRD